MSADLLAMLNAGMPGASMSNRNRQEEGKTILTFKSGKMKTELQQNGKYLVSPDPRRGTLSLVWTANSSSSSGGNSAGNNSSNNNNGGQLKLEWKDRRTRTVVDSLPIFPEDDCTYSRVDTGRENDRVYLLQYGNASDRRFFFWLQEKEDKDDEDNCVKMNVLMSDAEECAKAAGAEGGASSSSGGGGGDASGSGGATSSSGGGASGEGGPDVSNLGGGALDNQALMQIMQGLGTQGGSSGSGAAAGSGSGNATPSSGQVDALSSILENLGMPQNQQGSGGGDNAATTATPGGATTSATTAAAPTRGSGEGSDSAAPAPAASGGGMLTLADLQGAMAGLSTATPAATMGASAGGPPLSELATPESIAESGILDSEEVKAKLIALLPEGQRNEEMLKDTLRSPQVVQCLKSLTAALVSDDGSLDGLNSVLANFDLKAEDGAAAIASGNPIQAFLDCVLKSVEREKEAKKEESGESKEESKKESGGDSGGDAMEEGG